MSTEFTFSFAAGALYALTHIAAAINKKLPCTGSPCVLKGTKKIFIYHMVSQFRNSVTLLLLTTNTSLKGMERFTAYLRCS